MLMNLLQVRMLLRALTSKEGYQIGFNCLETELRERYLRMNAELWWTLHYLQGTCVSCVPHLQIFG